MNNFLKQAFLVIIICLLMGNRGLSQQYNVVPDTILLSMRKLTTLEDLSEIYPYGIAHPDFYYFTFRQFEAVFYRPQRGTFTVRHGKGEWAKHGLPYSFYSIIHNEIPRLAVSLGTKIKIQHIMLQSDDKVIPGKPFFISVGRIIPFIQEKIKAED